MSVVVVEGMQQSPLALAAWAQFLRDRPVANVLEIGTGLGGFARFLSTYLRPGATLVTVDRKQRWSDVWPHNVMFMLHDVRQNPVALEVLLRVMARPILLMCDNGNKIWEVNHYGPLLQAGDVLAVHDYATDLDWFHERLRGKLWDWHECDERDIASVLADGFEPISEEVFSIAAWGVWEKRAVVHPDDSPKPRAR